MPTPTIPTPQANGYPGDAQRSYSLAQAPTASPMPAPTPQQHHMQSAYTPTHPTHYHTHSQSPAPHVSHQPVAHAPSYQPITPHLPFSTPQPSAVAPQYATPRAAPAYQQPLIHQAPVGYKAPQPVEVYILSDHANASIPPDIRDQFQRDEQGRVLFFTAPPVNSSRIVQKEGSSLGHSAKYLAAKTKRDAEIMRKRKADEAQAAEREEAAKKARKEAEEKLKKDIAEAQVKAIHALEDRLTMATARDIQMLMNGEENKDAVMKSLDQLVAAQKANIAKNQERYARAQQQKNGWIPVTGMTAMLEEKI